MKATAVIQTNQKLGMKLNKNKVIKRVWYFRYLYLLFLPAAIYYAVYAYAPMYGATLAFKIYDYSKGIMGSPWVGLDQFKILVFDPEFLRAFKNTIVISFSRLIFEFPIPIVLALLINEVRSVKYKRVVQTVFTFPHFLSWVVIYGIVFNILSDQGVLNQFIIIFGGSKTHLLADPSTFRPLLYITDIWREAGWSTIIYLAAISGINVEQYEAARVDGAKRFHMVRYITFPALRNVIGILLILQIGSAMNANFDQIFNLYSVPVYPVSDIIDTLIYRNNFGAGATMDFAYSTAIGLFKSVINLMLLTAANYGAKRFNDSSLF